MTNRHVFLAIGTMALLASMYIAFFLQQTVVSQSELKDVHTIGLAVVAAFMTYVFTRRVSQISRVDTWVREYVKVIQDLTECINNLDQQSFTDKDRHTYAKFHSLIQIQFTTLRTVCPLWVVNQFIRPDEEHKFLDCLEKLARVRSDEVEQARELTGAIKHKHIASLHQSIFQLYL